MTEAENLLVRNLLNGVAPETAARAAGLAEEEGLAAFAEAMRRVAEYRMVHCMPFFECGTLAQARASRLYVLQALEEIAWWDGEGRELMIEVFKGGRPQRARGEIEAIADRTLAALPFYLEKDELPAYRRGRMAFIRDHRARVVGLLERFVSFRAPLLLKNIAHETIHVKQP